jgi:hypothetical protein
MYLEHGERGTDAEGDNRCSTAIDDAVGDREVPGAGGAGDDELIVDADVAEDGGSANQVAREHGALQPR